MAKGYYRFPTIHKDTIVFVCEDDLWTVPASGGVARRLTSNRGKLPNHGFRTMVSISPILAGKKGKLKFI